MKLNWKVVVAALGLFVGVHPAFAKSQTSSSSRASASSKATRLEAEQDVSPTFQIDPVVDFRFFNWGEYDPNGVQNLSESGVLFAVGVDPRFSFGKEKRFFVEAGTRVYFGKVDYDGFLMGGQGGRTPYKSKTGYFGLEFAPTAGYVFSLSRDFQLSPLAGFGFEYWDRDIDDGGRTGYDEFYTVFRFNTGLRGTYILNRNVRFHSTLMLKVPFSISESSVVGARQGRPIPISVSPGISPAFLIEGGTTIHGVDLALYFETWTLTPSNVDNGLHQPESTRKIFGIKMGYSFGI
jgi:hypothetical protein